MKQKLPVIRWKAADISQTERLQRWTKEREMVLLLKQENGTQKPGTSTGLRSPEPLKDLIADFDAAFPQPGEIRLLSSALLPNANRPVYVLVLADWEGDLKLIAPFGPMTEPATPGELRTLRDETALAVLCLWNTHSVPASHLAKSWMVDRMSESELAEAWAVFRHTATGAPVDAALEARIGMPILDESDPRIPYQEEEAALLASLIPVEESTPEQEQDHDELVFAANERQASADLEFDHELALEAGESHLPEQLDISHLLPGFTGFGRGSVRRPGEATVFSFSCKVSELSNRPSPIIVSWPGGESRLCSFEDDYGDWVVDIEIEVPWKSAVALLNAGRLNVTPQG